MGNIVRLSEAATIGLHAMVVVATEGKAINVIKISEKIDSSRHHVAKVMQKLSRSGLLSSTRGPSGGFILKKQPEEITLFDIYKAVEGEPSSNGCPADKEECPFIKCIFDNIANKLSLEFKDYMEQKRLSTYV